MIAIIEVQNDEGYIVRRSFQGFYEEMHSRDWNERVRSVLDDANDFDPDTIED